MDITVQQQQHQKLKQIVHHQRQNQRTQLKSTYQPIPRITINF